MLRRVASSALRTRGYSVSATTEEEQKKQAETPKEKKQPVSSEYSEFSVDELKDMLSDAIGREDYEQAAAIRDEMARRKGQG